MSSFILWNIVLFIIIIILKITHYFKIYILSYIIILK